MPTFGEADLRVDYLVESASWSTLTVSPDVMPMALDAAGGRGVVCVVVAVATKCHPIASSILGLIDQGDIVRSFLNIDVPAQALSRLPLFDRWVRFTKAPAIPPAAKVSGPTSNSSDPGRAGGVS